MKIDSGIIMKYLFCIVYLMFSISSSLFAGEGSLIECSPRRGGKAILNCKKDEDCLQKKDIYHYDVICGVAKVYKISDDQVYEDISYIPKDIKKSYLSYQIIREQKCLKMLEQNEGGEFLKNLEQKRVVSVNSFLDTNFAI